MDIDPILDAHPPRYALESDSEDEFGQNIHPRVPRHFQHAKAELVLQASVDSNVKLVLAVGLAGTEWLSGIDLDAEIGTLRWGEMSIGLLHRVPQGACVIYVHHSLPSHICRSVASTILATLKPASIAVLDSYAAPSYVAASPISPYDSPVRVLRNSAAATTPKTLPGLPFSPPNLVQLLPAALLSATEPSTVPTYLILLPSLHVPSPPSSQPMPIAPSMQMAWSNEAMAQAHNCLATTLGVSNWAWDSSSTQLNRPSKIVRPPRGDIVGEGGMYI